MFVIPEDTDTFATEVRVRIKSTSGAFREGAFKGVFRRIDQAELERMVEDNLSNLETLDRVLVSVSGIGRTPSEELPADQALDYVRASPECCAAAVLAFFGAMKQEPDSSTSRRRRGRG